MNLEHTILIKKNWSLVSQIKHQELLKKLNKSKEDNATERRSDDDYDNEV